MQSLSASQFDAALRAVDAEGVSAESKAEMLMEIAIGLQVRPKSPEQLHQAIGLYERALAICPAESPVLHARLEARLGTALQALPDGGVDALYRALAQFESALDVLRAKGSAVEVAEIDLNRGLTLQALAGLGKARIFDAIESYHRALRTFTRTEHAKEYAILHNNLAIAYLLIPLSDERGAMREALAVQSFEEALKVVSLVDHPSEYAMLQNNLGNALQYAASGHPLANNLRALAAYDEALKVRNRRDSPLEYANTLANKANVLLNLPLDATLSTDAADSSGAQGCAHPEDPDPVTHLETARHLYEEARAVFREHHQAGSVSIVDEALADLAERLGLLRDGREGVHRHSNGAAQ